MPQPDDMDTVNEPVTNDDDLDQRKVVTEDDLVDPGDLGKPPVEPEEGAEPEPEPQPEPEPFSPKHKTWEDTESARLELEKSYTQGQQELSELKKKVDELEGKKEPDEPKPKESIAQKVMREFREKAALVSRDDPNYDQKVTDLYGEAQQEIAQETLRAEDARRKQVQDDIDMGKRVVQEHGWEMEADIPELGGKVNLGEEMFWQIASSPLMPKGVGEEKQIQWIFAIMDAVETAIINKHEQKKAEAGGGPSDLLKKGSKGPVKVVKKEEPSTLQQDSEELEKSRILTGKDF